MAEDVVVAAETEEKPVKAVRIPTPEKDDANELLKVTSRLRERRGTSLLVIKEHLRTALRQGKGRA